MTYVFNMHEAKTKLSQLVELAESGQEVLIARSGRVAARLVPAEAPSRPLFGEFEPLEGWISDDFDQTPEEWKAAMDKDLLISGREAG